ncbi:M48 family metallopeptidase [Szabonella alba]|uniref:M48 family metallopeptidase n=1 Tax=Szabonella alba TaxID=2804194 RepID=A0A8K0Y2N4_9RHOB|nr:M48 family metallopeptidase [Szabonella alba]MBL4918409.1 M48 family metallopeptidase [Szabonella alba]
MTGAAPVPAQFFDGHSARRHAVLVSPTRDGSGLMIERAERGGTAEIWPLDRLRRLADTAGRGELILTRLAETEDESPRDVARLVLSDPGLIGWVTQNAPGLDRRDTRQGTARRIVTRLALAVAAILVMLFVILPRMSDFMAERLPLETEQRFGRAVVDQMQRFLGARDGQNLTCEAPEGVAALNRMVARLSEGRDLAYPLQVGVLNHRMVNAFAAPGGHVMLVRGLLDQAESPEEVAAVLAHEIGHVEARDSTRLMLRAAGSAGIVSIVLGDVSGGTLVAIAGEYLLQSAYTREAEAGADRFALEMLNAAGVSSQGMADFFLRIGGKSESSIPEYLSSHPSSAARAGRAAENAQARPGSEPVLTEDEWRDLRAICDGFSVAP